MHEPRQPLPQHTSAKAFATYSAGPFFKGVYVSAFSRILALIASVVFAAVTGCATTDPTTANGNQFGAIEYQVKQGDNLVLIAAEVTRNRDNWRLIADYNAIGNPATLSVGQRIWIPRDLIPLNEQSSKTRSVAGHPDAVVNSVARPTEITPISTD